MSAFLTFVILALIAGVVRAQDDMQTADSRIITSQTYLTNAERAAVFAAFSQLKVSTFQMIGYPIAYVGVTTDDAAAAFPDAVATSQLGASPDQTAHMDTNSAPGDHTRLDMVSRSALFLKALTAMNYANEWVTNTTAALANVPSLDSSGGLALSTAGGTLKVKQSPSGSACMGVGAQLAGSGTKTVTTSCAASGDLVLVTRTIAAGLTPGTVTVLAAAGSFTITSSGGALDTSTFSWLIVKAAP